VLVLIQIIVQAQKKKNCSNDIDINNVTNLNLGLVSLYTQKNIVILDSNIQLNSTSSIVSNGCINITNSQFTVDLSKTSASETIVLMNSKSGCLNITNYSISYLNEPKCGSAQTQKNSKTLTIVISNTCPTGLAGWVIAVIIIASIVGVLLILVAIVLLVPSLRRRVISFGDDEDNRDTLRDTLPDNRIDLTNSNLPGENSNLPGEGSMMSGTDNLPGQNPGVRSSIVTV